MRNVRSNDNYVRTFLLNVFPLHCDRFSIIGDIHDKDGGGFLGVTSYLRALKESLYHTSSYIKICDCIFSTLELQLIIAFASHVKCLEFNLCKFILEDELTLSGVKYKIEKLVFDLCGSDRYSGWVTHLERLKKLLTAIYISDDTKSIKSIVVNDCGLNKNIVKEVYEEYEERNQLILNQNDMSEIINSTINDIKQSLADPIINEGRKRQLEKAFETILLSDHKFDKNKHFSLIDNLTDKLLELKSNEVSHSTNQKETRLFCEIIIDFLFRFKDKYPFSNSSNEWSMDVFDRIVEFMFENDFWPSKELQCEYLRSEINQKLALPSYEFLNDIFKGGMNKEIYDNLESRYASLPPFNYFFNSNLEIKVKYDPYKYEGIFMGIFNKSNDDVIGVGLRISNTGWMYQGYFKCDKRSYYGRNFYSVREEYYEGGWKNHGIHGKGFRVFPDGTKEIGTWKQGQRLGMFKIIHPNGKEIKKFYCDEKNFEDLETYKPELQTDVSETQQSELTQSDDTYEIKNYSLESKS